MKKRLVITGMGAVTPIGTGTDKYWNNLIHGECGVDHITRFDASNLPVQIAAEVKDFEPKNYISAKLIREMDLFQQFAFAAATEALEQSGFPVEEESQRIGIVMATALNGTSATAQTQEELSSGKAKKVSPRFVPKILGNLAAAQFSIAKGIHGPSYTINTACSSGGDALAMAGTMILAGQADAMIVMGGENGLCEVTISSLAQAKALSRNNDNPKAACRPFDADRDGFIMGEGGGALVLETEEHAKKRGAGIYAELAGWANNNDAYHVINPIPDGTNSAACMLRALERGGIAPEEVGYINAHGTGTKTGDRAEMAALRRVFGPSGVRPAVSSTKGATGHMMGSGGITEAIACIQAIRCGVLPPTLNLEEPEGDFNFVAEQYREQEITVAMSNAFGFGGQNSSLVFRGV